MKIKTLTLAFFFLCAARALDAYTYLYRVVPGSVAPVKTLASDNEVKTESQPFYTTSVLAQADTNYFLVKVTLKDASDPQFEKFIGSTDLYQTMRMDSEGFIRLVIDNSKLFPTNKNWAVEVSSK